MTKFVVPLSSYRNESASAEVSILGVVETWPASPAVSGRTAARASEPPRAARALGPDPRWRVGLVCIAASRGSAGESCRLVRLTLSSPLHSWSRTTVGMRIGEGQRRRPERSRRRRPRLPIGCGMTWPIRGRKKTPRGRFPGPEAFRSLACVVASIPEVTVRSRSTWITAVRNRNGRDPGIRRRPTKSSSGPKSSWSAGTSRPTAHTRHPRPRRTGRRRYTCRWTAGGGTGAASAGSGRGRFGCGFGHRYRGVTVHASSQYPLALTARIKARLTTVLVRGTL